MSYTLYTNNPDGGGGDFDAWAVVGVDIDRVVAVKFYPWPARGSNPTFGVFETLHATDTFVTLNATDIV